MTRQKGANLMHYYVEKAGFLMKRHKLLTLMQFYVESRFSRDVPKRCKFVPLLRGKASFS